MINRLLGPLLLLTSYLLYTIAHAIVKILIATVPPAQIMLGRFIVAPLILIPMYMLRLKLFIMPSPFLMAIRVTCGCSAMFCYFIAVKMGDLGKASLLFQFCIIWSFVLSMLLFKDRPSIYTKVAIPISFIGLVMVLQPNFSTGIRLGDLFALLASFFNTGVILSLKQLRHRYDSSSIIITNYTIASLFMAPTVGSWIMLNQTQWILISTMAIIGLAGQFLMTIGFKHTPASIASSMALIGVPLTYGFSVVFFHEVVNTMALFGIGIVLISLYVVTKYQ